MTEWVSLISTIIMAIRANIIKSLSILLITSLVFGAEVSVAVVTGMNIEDTKTLTIFLAAANAVAVFMTSIVPEVVILIRGQRRRLAPMNIEAVKPQYLRSASAPSLRAAQDAELAEPACEPALTNAEPARLPEAWTPLLLPPGPDDTRCWRVQPQYSATESE